MIYALHLYKVEARNLRVFSAVFAEDGPWHKVSRNLNGHIHTDLLRRPTHPRVFLSIEFWTSESCYTSAQSSAEILAFSRRLRTLTESQTDLGLFSLSWQAEERFTDRNAFPRIISARSRHRGSEWPPRWRFVCPWRRW